MLGAGLTALTLSLAACAETLSLHGHVPDAEREAEIASSQATQPQVAEALGSPSFIAPFDGNVWIYFSQVQKQVAFFTPEIVSRDIFLVEFDDSGRVQDTRRYTMADGKTVTPVGRTTPTLGNELTLLQQLFGNFGRFAGTERPVTGNIPTQ
ncbi:MAG: outer membrane protein assembly factor BamE [Alphaproteobacteria bacterium]